jgi:4-amino-4-deoxy-L-arabinose transferase-like glycosyltransferase
MGLGLRAYQYIWNKSLYVDEAALAENIIARTFVELGMALDHNQVAPLGFLYLERLAVQAFGNSEYALRLFPFLAALASVPLFWAVAARTLPRAAALFALAMFGISPRLIYYAAEVKQYSSDIAIVLALTLGGLWLSRDLASWRRLLVLSIAGAVAVWFSNPAIFYLAAIGLFLAVQAYREGELEQLARLGAMGILWLASFGLSYLAARRGLADAQFMEGWWAEGFLPFPLRSSADLSQWVHVLAKLAREPLEFMVPVVAIACFGVGIVALLKSRPIMLILLGGPLALAIVASILRLYPLGGGVPLSGRVVLYLAPVLILLVAQGAESVRTLVGIRPGIFAAALALAMVAPRVQPESLVPLYRNVPSAQAHVWIPRSPPIVMYPEYRPVLEELATARLPGELIYVYEGAVLNFRYYAPRLGFEPVEWVAGRTGGKSRDEVIRDLTPLLGRGRIWIFLTNTWSGEEQHFISALGQPLRAIPGRGALALLYDFGSTN